MRCIHIVAWDVRDPRRLRRLHRRLSRRALALQDPVFLFCGSERALRRLERELAKLVRPEDDLRIWPFPDGTQLWTHGPGALPRGVLFADEALLRTVRRGGRDGRAGL